jgi:hypothetical protein
MISYGLVNGDTNYILRVGVGRGVVASRPGIDMDYAAG